MGDVLRDLAKDQLQDERQSKASLAQRAAIVISTSGTLVTLLLSASALVTKSQSFNVPPSVLATVAAVAVLLVLAAIVALLVNAPWTQAALPVEPLRSANYRGVWSDVDAEQQQKLYDDCLDLISDLRVANKWRARFLMLALSLECFAVAALTISVLTILL